MKISTTSKNNILMFVAGWWKCHPVKMEGTMIDYEKLRKDLSEDSYTAAFSGLGASFLDAVDIEKASDEELLEIAKRRGFTLNKYIIQ